MEHEVILFDIDMDDVQDRTVNEDAMAKAIDGGYTVAAMSAYMRGDRLHCVVMLVGPKDIRWRIGEG
jgi:hypothetical protein